jgi:metallo-beta-lactamase family protein
MDIKVRFLGGAGSVTGSKYILDIGDKRIMVDCGLFQGPRELRRRNWDDLAIPASSIDAVIITHAHIDHSGYLPRLVKQGYGGPIYCTIPTFDLMEILLRDAAKLQEEEAAFAQKKGYSRHEKPLPLYTLEDAEMVFPMVRPVPINEEIVLFDQMWLSFSYAGHILGAASAYLRIKGDAQEKTLLFSGDIGRYDHPIFYDPVCPPKVDVLFIESTYGNRQNPDEDIEADFAQIVNEAMDRQGVLLIPAFAVGRTQGILFYLKKLRDEGRIPKVDIFVDSPMAIDNTRLYLRHPAFHRLSREELETQDTFLHFDGLHYCYSQEKSKALNQMSSKAIIISASGMLSGGRILHHLYHRLPHEQDTLMFAGFQAVGTRGRDILEGTDKVRIFGQEVEVHCQKAVLDGLSAHADKPELLRWANQISGHPKFTFLVHGEHQASEELMNQLQEEKGWHCFIPEYLESFLLFEGI